MCTLQIQLYWLKGEVQFTKILLQSQELFLGNFKIIAILSSLPCNCDSSASKLVLFTIFAIRKTPSWIWCQLWRGNSQALLNTLTWLSLLTIISYEISTMVNCHITYKNTKGIGVSFCKLPKNENLRKLWLVKMKCEDVLLKPKSCYVC